MYLTFPNQDTMDEDFLEQTRGRDIDLFVCSDAEAILGIGDQGVGVSGRESLRAFAVKMIKFSAGHRCTQALKMLSAAFHMAN
jgi:hypothetical protein